MDPNELTEAALRECELLRDGAFLLDRLDDFEREILDDNLAREWSGHVMPAIARFRAHVAKATSLT